MGAISKGHTFSDGDTVTAAKLNNLVDNATLNNDSITGAMIADSAISSNHLAAGAVSGASLSSNTVALTALSNASSGSSGTIIQSGTGGAFQELSLGAAGTILKVGSSNLAEWGTVDSSGVNTAMISGHSDLASPGAEDMVLVKEKDGVNKSLQLQNLFKAVSDLDTLAASDVAGPDEHLIIDGGNAKKITQANLQTATLSSVNDLTALTDTTVADDDVLLVYDTSTSTVKKIAKSDLLYGTSRYLASGRFVCTSSGPSVTSSWTTNIASVTHSYGASNHSRVNITFTDAVSVDLPIFAHWIQTNPTSGTPANTIKSELEIESRTTTSLTLDIDGGGTASLNPIFVFYIPTDV